jgi:hypothetical protein
VYSDQAKRSTVLRGQKRSKQVEVNFASYLERRSLTHCGLTPLIYQSARESKHIVDQLEEVSKEVRTKSMQAIIATL